MLRNARGEVIDFNDQAVSIMGVPRTELEARPTNDTSFDTWREDGSDFPYEEQPAQVTRRTGKPCFDVVMGVAYARQQRHWVITSTAQVPLSTGEVGVISTFYDVTPRIKSRRILKLVAETNRNVITSKNENECLAQLCEMLVSIGGFKLALIGPASFDDDHTLEVSFAAGATEYLEVPLTPWWKSTKILSGSSSSTRHTDAMQVFDDLDASRVGRVQPCARTSVRHGVIDRAAPGPCAE